MLKMLKVTSCVVAGFFISTTAIAAGELKLTNFEIGVSSLFQDSQYSVSPLIRYAPYFQINDSFALGFSADIARHKFDDDTNFNAINLLANVSWAISVDWILGASAGVESTDCSGCETKTAFALSIYRTLPYEFIGLKGQSVFIQGLSIATDPTTTGAILGTQFQF